MRAKSTFLLAGLGALSLVGDFAIGQSVETPPPRASPATTDDVSAIRDARDPSSAIDAYGRAIVADPASRAAERAFVRRMVEFGRPETAEFQARDLADRDPTDGFSRGVLAYVETQRGEEMRALRDIVEAARLSPDEAFVQRTAAELLAWYDTRVNQPALSDDLAAGLASMRASLSRRDEFAAAYKRALATYSNLDQPTAPEAPIVLAEPPTTTYVETRYVYTDPYAGRWYAPSWPDPWRSSYWGPPAVVIVDRDARRRAPARAAERRRDVAPPARPAPPPQAAPRPQPPRVEPRTPTPRAPRPGPIVPNPRRR